MNILNWSTTRTLQCHKLCPVSYPLLICGY